MNNIMGTIMGIMEDDNNLKNSPEGINALLTGLTDPNPEIRRNAAFFLGDLKDLNSEELMENIINRLSLTFDIDDDDNVKSYCLKAIVKLNPKSQEAINIIAKALTGKYQSPRYSALDSLEYISQDSEEISDALIKAVYISSENKENRFLRCRIIFAIASIKSDPSKRINSLLNMLEDKEELVRNAASSSLIHLSKLHREAWDFLMKYHLSRQFNENNKLAQNEIEHLYKNNNKKRIKWPNFLDYGQPLVIIGCAMILAAVITHH